MSVINQMLQGLDKGTQQQQADVESSGAVIVAAPKSQNKLVIVLFSSIVIFAALAGYLFVQKQSRAAKISVQHHRVVPVVSSENNAQVNEPLIVKLISAELVEQPMVIKLNDVKATMAAPIVIQPLNLSSLQRRKRLLNTLRRQRMSQSMSKTAYPLKR